MSKSNQVETLTSIVPCRKDIGLPRYRRKPNYVDAIQVDKETTIELYGTPYVMSPGDYLVTTAKGHQFIYPAEMFEREYERDK